MSPPEPTPTYDYPKGLTRLGLTARTISNLRLMQLVHRIRLRGQRAAFGLVPPQITRRLRVQVRSNGWPEGFVPMDSLLEHSAPSPEANSQGSFDFLNEARRVHNWTAPGADQLWSYHLYYMEWAWSFAVHPDRDWARTEFQTLWRKWDELTQFGRSDAWAPYVVSLRTWVMCGAFATLVAGSGLEERFVESIALHAGYLRANLELDVGGNHLIKNLKALIGAGVFLGEESLVEKGSARLRDQLSIQVLEDGGHFERSPAYHCQVLQDLIDLDSLLGAQAAGIPDLAEAIEAMRGWLGSMMLPEGGLPNFNDSWAVGEGRLQLLKPVPPDGSSLCMLKDSGYFKASVEPGLMIVGDVGPPCPDDLPAHAHADCLSFELLADGRRVVVNTGTSTYSASPRRYYERSTAAHNTIGIDGRDQTEVWGSFRAGARARPTLLEAAVVDSEIRVSAEHDGYRRLRGKPIHQRSWSIRDSSVTIDDTVRGHGLHELAWRCFAAPTVAANWVEGKGRIGPLSLRLTWIGDVRQVDFRAHPKLVSTGFGISEESTCLEATFVGILPLQITATFNHLEALGDGR